MICWRAEGQTDDPLWLGAEGRGIAAAGQEELLENKHEVGRDVTSGG